MTPYHYLFASLLLISGLANAGNKPLIIKQLLAPLPGKAKHIGVLYLTKKYRDTPITMWAFA
jgi:hypothetical protein